MNQDGPQQEQISSEDLQEAHFAHELAHGLAALSSNLRMAVEITSLPQDSVSPKDWEYLKASLEVIQHEVNSQIDHALTILAHRFPHLAVGIQRPVFEFLRPTDVMVSLLPIYEKKLRKRAIRMVVNYDSFDALPKIEIEVHAIRRIFHNLLSNALKYSYSGFKVDRHIKIWAKRHDAQGHRWAVVIQNYGIGFDPEEKPKLFTPGYRGVQAKAESTFGSGLGLSEVQRCMALHGGYLDIESKQLPGEAYVTTATLIFPTATHVRSHFPDAANPLGR
jgi:signal transduction histidine kinase